MDAAVLAATSSQNSHVSKSRILVVLSVPPSISGHGGNHRSYQLAHDLEKLLPECELFFVSMQDLLRENKEKNRRLWRKARLYIANKLRFGVRLAGVGGSLDNLTYGNLLNLYRTILDENQPFDLSIVEESMFPEIIEMNHAYGIPTWICPQNINSLDLFAVAETRTRKMPKFLWSFQRELKTFSHSNECLTISLTERWILNGLDFPAHYYPYLPVGEVRGALLEVRRKREQGKIDPNLFLLIGSSTHETTAKGLEWFINNLREGGMPAASEIIVVGKGTEKYAERFKSVLGLKFRGWISNEELFELLGRVKALLAPQVLGFGALTRVSESSCAGVPFLVSEHAAQSIDSPPGVIALPTQWTSWVDAISNLQSTSSIIPDWAAYHQWEGQQPNPLRSLAKQYLDLG